MANRMFTAMWGLSSRRQEISTVLPLTLSRVHKVVQDTVLRRQQREMPWEINPLLAKTSHLLDA